MILGFVHSKLIIRPINTSIYINWPTLFLSQIFLLLTGDAGVKIVCRAVRLDYNGNGPEATCPARST